jgi:Ca-activated chloride channel homolog
MAIRPRIRAATAAAVFVLLIIPALAGCGSSGGGADSAPAHAPVDDAAGAPDADRTGGSGDGSTSTGEDPQSTFAVDVDTASYGYARRQILAGRLPAASTVRPEEFVNAFDQDYREPAGNGFAVHADGSRLPAEHRAGSDVRLMRIGLQTRGEGDETRPDATLTFVVDTSGSMSEPGRLDLVRAALHTLVDRLRPTDSVAIVAFSGSARVVRAMTPVSSGSTLHAAIDTLVPESSTNLEAGLVLGYEQARAGFRPRTSNRVVVLSDGLANSGSTSADRILARVREQAAKQIALLGVGVGSEYGDALMERLADGGDGFVVYVSELEQAREVFVRRLPATLSVRALDAKVQVTFDPKAVTSYRLIGYENRAVADHSFRDDRVDGGEVGPGHSVTALYEVRLAEGAGGGDTAARVDVRWLDPASREADEATRTVRVGDLNGGFTAAPARLQVDYAAAFLAESLRSPSGNGPIALDVVGRIARSAAGLTADRAVTELAEVIERANRLR